MGASNAAVVAGEYPNLVGCIVLEDPPWRSEAIESAQERQARLEGWRQEIVENQSKTREEIIPTLLVTANPDQGALVTPKVTKQIVEMNATIQVVHIEGAGHNIRREQFQAYVEGVEKFLVETWE